MKTCNCGLEMILEPVPGATHFPRRLVCVACGPEHFRPNKMSEGDGSESPNDYYREVASPADVTFVDDIAYDLRY